MKARNQAAVKMFSRALAGLGLIVSPVALYAQSCAMCYQSAAASGPRSIHAINTGILILMFPPALITLGFFCLAYKKRNTFVETRPGDHGSLND